MMKKNILGLAGALMLVFSLASCKKSTTLDRRADLPQASTINELKLDDVKNGVDLYEADTTSKDYYVIKYAANPKSTIFVYNTSIDSFLEEYGKRNRSVNVSPLCFCGEIQDSEQTAIMKNVFSKNSKINELKLGFEIDHGSKWTKTISTDAVIKKYNDGQKNNYVSTAYLPVHIIRYVKGSELLNVYVLLPLHSELTTINNGINSYEGFKSLKTVDLTFDENKTLLI